MKKQTFLILAGAILSAASHSNAAVYSEIALQQIPQQGVYPPFQLTPQAYQLRIDNSGQIMGEVYESNFYDPIIWSNMGVAVDMYNPFRNSGVYLGEGTSGDFYGETSSGALLCVIGSSEYSVITNKNGTYQISLVASNPFITSNGLVVHAMDNKGDLLWMNLQMSYAGVTTASGSTKYIPITQMPFINCMNDNLHAVGFSPAIYQYSNGSITAQQPIAIPTGYSANSFDARWINGSDEVVGTLQNSSGAFEPFEWTPANGMIFLNTGGFGSGIAECINSEGDIVGSIGSGSSGEAVVWKNGTPENLNTMLPAGSANITLAYQITDSGYILASQINAPYILSPTSVPEPSFLTLVSLISLSLLNRRRI